MRDLLAAYYGQRRGWDVLPSGYRRVSYLRSTGMQYIDTGVPGFQPLRLCATVSFLGFSAPQTQGLGNQSGKQCRCAIGVVGDRFFAGFGSVNHVSYFYLGLDTKYTMVADAISGRCSCNDYSYEATGSFIGSTVHLSLFTRSNDIRDNPCRNMRLYSATIDSGSERLREFIPCVRTQDGKPGMYDTVTDAFFTNRGTSDFLTPEDNP